MKKIISSIIIFAFFASVSAQLKVNSLGSVEIGGGLCTIGNGPISFKVGNSFAGSTGNSAYTNVSFGFGALYNSAPIYYNTAIGYEALFQNTSGVGNAAIGYQTLYSNTTGSCNTATGNYSLYFNTTGDCNTAVSCYSLYNNTTGGNNTANGYNALRSNTTGCYNTATGSDALYTNTIGGGNTANGSFSLYRNTTGYNNTASGSYALSFNTTGIMNTASGYESLTCNTTGNYNAAIGFHALTENTTGNNNTAAGLNALGLNETGWNNTACGAATLRNIDAGSNNTAIGCMADVGYDTNNATAIGYCAEATGSDQVRIGNSNITSIGGFTNWTNFSDGRAKKNIRTNVPGLDFINRLQPITYNLDLNAVDNLLITGKTRKNSRDSLMQSLPPELKAIINKSREAKEKEVQTGFVAQDVEKTAKSIGYDFSGVDVDESGIYSLRYAEFVVPLVKAVQELSDKNDAKDATIASLQEQVNELTRLVNKLLGKDATESSALRSENGDASITGLTNLADIASASLEQNIPNPFNHTTVVHYTLPETCTSAKILITNTGGHVIQQIPLSVSGGHDSITIKGGSLQAGIYLYSLICDGKVVDTKRMILTK